MKERQAVSCYIVINFQFLSSGVYFSILLSAKERKTDLIRVKSSAAHRGTAGCLSGTTNSRELFID